MFKKFLKQFLIKAYIKPSFIKNMPSGIDWMYDIKYFHPKIDINTIFDVGANVGNITQKLNRVFPNANILSIEPEHNSYNSLSKLNRIDNIETYNLALGKETKQVKVNFDPFSERNSINSPSEVKSDSGSIKVVNTSEFSMSKNIDVIDILKTDTEGYDLEVIKGAEPLLKENKINFILTEIRFTKHDNQHTNISEIIRYMDNFDYRLFQVYEFSETNHFIEWGPSYANALFVNLKAIHNLT